MKDKPIIFQGWEVRKILEWDFALSDMMTRRPVKPQDTFHIKCPYEIGQTLWVRETWAKHPRFKTLLYRADGEEYEDAPGYGIWKPTWKPSIFIPRKLSRIDLEVTGIRVERLQDITEADAVKEGFERREHFIRGWDKIYSKKGTWHIWEDDDGIKHKEWVKIDLSFDSNPFVWVYSFKRIKP